MEMTNIEKFKNFQIQYKKHQSYLYAFVSGDRDSTEISIEFWTLLVNKCIETGYKKLLVEEELKSQVSTMDMYAISGHIAKLSIENSLKIAFIDNETEHEELNMFGENVAQNRGAYGKIFKTIEKAKAWLLK